jgi:hypothetical protein
MFGERDGVSESQLDLWRNYSRRPTKKLRDVAGNRKIFGPKRDEMTGDWRKLHNEELHNLYFSPNMITMIKSRRMRWTRHVARTGRRGTHIAYWWESQKERDH